MSQKVRSFRAATADEALALVHQELGQDAVVVEVNQIASRGLIAWLTSRQEFEVRASRAVKKEVRRPSVTPTTMNTIAAAAAAAKSQQDSHDFKKPVGATGIGAAVMNRHGESRRAQFATKSAKPTPLANHSTPAIVKAHLDELTAQSIEQRLDSLQQMIADLSRRSAPRGLVDIPPELFPHYLTLVESGVEDQVAHDLMQTLNRSAATGQLNDTSSTMELLTALIEQRLPCADSLAPVRGRREIAVLVGPTGVGKTTTLAKLAGHFGVEQGFRVGLITVDTYRVAAAEQLRTYAEIIDLPMRVVTNAAQMQEALDAFSTCELVLIDTAGRAPQDDGRLAEFKQLVDAACADHIYLVLSLASGATTLRKAAERFAIIRPTSLVLTKLDEAAGCGPLLSATHDIGLPLAYFTNGQEVPLDLEPANPCRAARLILGTDARRPALGTTDDGKDI